MVDLCMRFVLLTFVMLLCSSAVIAQPWAGRTMAWHRSGARPFTTPGPTVLVDTLGADPTGSRPSDAAVAAALDQVRDGGTVVFGAGSYLLRTPVVVPSGTTIRGAGADGTTIRMSVGAGIDPIRIQGSMLRMIVPLNTPSARGDSVLVTPFGAEGGELMLRLTMQDSDLVFSDWARGSVGQLLEVRSRRGDSLMLNTPLRLAVDTARQPYLAFIRPAERIMLRCFTIEQMDSSTQQVDNISISHARDIVIDGVRSRKTNFGHIVFESSMHCTVTRCDLAESYGYGGGGRGYGVVLQFTSGDIRVEDNVFRTLRHSMLLQAGANGNVLAYNASDAPYWESFPSDAAGDLVLHGNWVFANLAEGNDVAHVVIDNSHGANGHHNAFLRNRAREYGLFMGASPYADSTMILGNEITSSSIIKGLFLTGGKGLRSVGNYVKSRLTPAADTTRVPASFIYRRKPAMYEGRSWPPHGSALVSERDTIPARRRQLAGINTCPCSDAGFTSVPHESATDTPPVATYSIDLRGRMLDPDAGVKPIVTCRIGNIEYRLVP
jgi:hypothetical protein